LTRPTANGARNRQNVIAIALLAVILTR
jgi:hypothetical protein